MARARELRAGVGEPLLHECDFQRGHYLADGHFDRAGYEDLAECVRRVLGLV